MNKELSDYITQQMNCNERCACGGKPKEFNCTDEKCICKIFSTKDVNWILQRIEKFNLKFMRNGIFHGHIKEL